MEFITRGNRVGWGAKVDRFFDPDWAGRGCRKTGCCGCQHEL